MKLQTWASVIVVLTWLVGDDPLCAVEASPSASADYAINRSYSTIGFSIYKWIVMKEEGVFREFYGSVHYDPAKPERSHIVITAQAASLDTGNSGRDAVLRSDDFFDAAKYPTLHFESEAVTVKDSHEIVLAGKLTIHGVTKQISIPVHINGTSDVPGVGTLAGFETTFTIDRTGYGVNGLRWSAGQLAIGNQVTIHIALGCLRTSAPRSEATALPTIGPYRTTESVRRSPDAYSQDRRIPASGAALRAGARRPP